MEPDNPEDLNCSSNRKEVYSVLSIEDETVKLTSGGDAKQKPSSSSKSACGCGESTTEDTASTLVVASTSHLHHQAFPEDEEPLFESILQLFLSSFGILWSLVITYWSCSNCFAEEETSLPSSSVLTFGILVLSTFLVQVAFFLPKTSPRRLIWERCKPVWFLCLVPGLTTIVLSLSNVLFVTKELQSRTYQRPWTRSRAIFLVESLSLGFFQSLLHLVLLVEEPESLHTPKGYVIVGGVTLFSFALAFTRYRYDSQEKADRFGLLFEKWARLICLWANKALWLVIYSFFVLISRMLFPEHKTVNTVGALVFLILIHEAPVLLLYKCPKLGKKSGDLLGGVMMIPQFTALIGLLIWVNIDPLVYSSDTGTMLFGIYFWAEVLILSGWMYDRCTGREGDDFITFYPQFFIDALT